MFLIVSLGMLILAAGDVGNVASAQPMSAEPIYAALKGAWVGSLEYRDYSNNSRVVLPTILDIWRPASSAGLALHYVYDDGPTKVVQDAETVTVNPATATYTVVSADGKETDSDSLVGIGPFLKAGAGELVRFGKGKENGKSVDVRTTLTVLPNSLIILKETRPLGGVYQFRDQYDLTRVKPASIGK